MPSSDEMKIYAPHNPPNPATEHNQDTILIALEGLTKDVSWIKQGIVYAVSAIAGITTVVVGLVITYTVSTHNDIDNLQTKVAHYEEIAKQHHGSAGCHLLIPHSTPEVVKP